MTITQADGDGPDAAPRIGPGVYPFHGRSRLGPIWRTVWARLADGQWHSAQVIALDLAVGTGEANPRAVATMLASACRRGTLEREIRKGYLWVRRTDVQAASVALEPASEPSAIEPPAARAPHIDPPRVPARARGGAR